MYKKSTGLLKKRKGNGKKIDISFFCVYNKDMERIYLDNAATTPLHKEVLEKMLPYLTDVFGNADSPHKTGRSAMAAVDNARDTLAALLNAKKSEIYFTSGGTESDNWAMLGGARAMKKAGRTQVILSAIEHHAVLSSAERLQEDGFQVDYLPVDEGGRVALNVVEELVSDNTALVCVMAANNETGVLQPIDKIAKIAHKVGALFFVDAVQAAPYIPIDVKAWDVDMLSISAHKFYGPKGSGALYIKSGVRVDKLVGGGEQERGLRGGTLNVPAIVGLAAAYEKTRLEQAQSKEKIEKLSALFLEKIACLDGAQRNGNPDYALPAILNLRFTGVENTAFLYNMDLNGVSLAAGSACASASIKPSHVLTAMGLDEVAAKESVRFSLGKYNTEEEILRAAFLTVETVKRLTK